MKSLTAKTLTTATVLGAALLGTAGTSYADDVLPDGAKVVGEGWGRTEGTAIGNAEADAARQCASGMVNGRPTGKVATGKWFDGNWKATYTSTCRSNGLSG